MLRLKNYTYVIDEITAEGATKLQLALSVVPTITGLAFDDSSRVLTVRAAQDPEQSIRLACGVVSAKLRTDFRARRKKRP